MNQERKSIRTRILAWVVGVTAVFFLLQSVLSYATFKSYITDMVRDKLQVQARESAGYTAQRISTISSIAQFIADDIEAGPQYDPKNDQIMFTAIANHIAKDKLIFGSGFWFEPYQYDSAKKFYGPYILNEGDKTRLTWEYNTPEYNYFKWDWYQAGIQCKEAVAITEPFFDPQSGVTMATAASPIIRNGKTIGAATVDFDMAELTQYVSKIKVGEKGKAFLITRAGNFMAFDVKKPITAKKDVKDPQLLALADTVLGSAETAVLSVNLNGQAYFASYAPVGSTGIKLVVILPQSEAFAVLSTVLVRMAFMFVFAVLAFVVLITLIVNRRISRPLSEIVDEAERIAGGDLRRQENEVVFENNEIGSLAQAFRAMATNARQLIGGMQQTGEAVKITAHEMAASAEELSATSAQVLTTIGELAKGATEQAQSAQNGNAMLQEMIQQLAGMAESAVESEQLTNVARGIAQEASGKVKLQKEKMLENKTVTNNVGQSITLLSDKSRQIGEIVQVISEIADMTNLLALNAAIEAARAGEQGRGFAVVAQEVRSLAEQSSEASKEITGLIHEIQNGVAHAVDDMHRAEVVIVEQESAVEETYNSFQNISEAVHKINVGIQAVARTAEQMNANAQKVGHAIEAIAAITQESAAGSEQVLSSSEQESYAIHRIAKEASNLAGLTSQLEKSINAFKV